MSQSFYVLQSINKSGAFRSKQAPFGRFGIVSYEWYAMSNVGVSIRRCPSYREFIAASIIPVASNVRSGG